MNNGKWMPKRIKTETVSQNSVSSLGAKHWNLLI